MSMSINIDQEIATLKNAASGFKKASIPRNVDGAELKELAGTAADAFLKVANYFTLNGGKCLNFEQIKNVESALNIAFQSQAMDHNSLPLKLRTKYPTIHRMLHGQTGKLLSNFGYESIESRLSRELTAVEDAINLG